MASSTALSPAPVILPSSMSLSARSRLMRLQMLRGLLGLKRWVNSWSLSRLILPSIQPKHTASSTASSYLRPSSGDRTFWIITHASFSSPWFSCSHLRHSSPQRKCLAPVSRIV